MALNIKNEETSRLARDLADRTGETVTGAITTAVRERLQRLEVDDNETAARSERLRRLAADSGARWTPELREADHGALLYDDRGLPR